VYTVHDNCVLLYVYSCSAAAPSCMSTNQNLLNSLFNELA